MAQPEMPEAPKTRACFLSEDMLVLGDLWAGE
jgi:hypothetical protein